MGNKLFTSHNSLTDEGINRGSFEMHPLTEYDLMSTTTSVQRKSVEFWEIFHVVWIMRYTHTLWLKMSKISILRKIPQEEAEESRPGLVRRKTEAINDILRHSYSYEKSHMAFYNAFWEDENSPWSMDRPVPISSVPRRVIKTGDQPFEYTVEGGCSEVNIIR